MVTTITIVLTPEEAVSVASAPDTHNLTSSIESSYLSAIAIKAALALQRLEPADEFLVIEADDDEFGALQTAIRAPARPVPPDWVEDGFYGDWDAHVDQTYRNLVRIVARTSAVATTFAEHQKAQENHL